MMFVLKKKSNRFSNLLQIVVLENIGILRKKIQSISSLKSPKYWKFQMSMGYIFLIGCLLFLASCGEDMCYTDANIVNGSVYHDRVMNINMTTQEGERDTGISVVSSKGDSSLGSVTLKVSGTVYMCYSSPDSWITYATTCNGGVKKVCKNSCPENMEGKECVNYALKCDSITISDSTLCGSQENYVCISGTKWKLFGKYVNDSSGQSWIILSAGGYIYAQKSSCTSNDCKNYDSYAKNGKQYINVNGTETLVTFTKKNAYTKASEPCVDSITCDSSGNKQYNFYDSKKGFTQTKIGTCKNFSQTQNKDSYGIKARNSSWTEIGENIYAGDILTFSVGGAIPGTPNALSKYEGYSYSNIDNTQINRYLEHRSRYADYCKTCTKSCASKKHCEEKCTTIDGFVPHIDEACYDKCIKCTDKCENKCDNCPEYLDYRKSLSDYPNCGAIKGLINDGYQMRTMTYTQADAKKGLWDISGDNLILKGINQGKCSEADNSDYSYFRSSNKDIYSKFGILSDLFKKGATEPYLSMKTFIPKQGFSRICAKIRDNEYTDNLGGYTLSVERKSCIAINGHPSPCCSDKRGALMYRWGTNDTWKEMSSDVLYSTGGDPPTSKTFTIKNDTTTSNTLYLKINNPSSRSDTSGSYSIRIGYHEVVSSKTISTLIEDIKKFIKRTVYDYSDSTSLVNRYFNKLLGDADYKQYIRLLLVLSVILYGLTFIMGYVEISQKDLLIRLLKMGVVLALITDQSYDFFRDYFFQMFIDGSDELLSKTNFINPNPINDGVFGFLDSTFALLVFNGPTWLKILAVSVTLPFGLIIFILFLVGIFWFLMGVMSAVVVYLMCFLAIAILIFLAPIFIPFMLFKQTNYLFKNWCKSLVRFAVEPAMLVIGLQVLVALFYAVLIRLIDFTVCWKCMIPINLGAISGIKSFLDTLSITTEVFCIPFFGIHGVYGSKAGGALFSGIGVSLANLILLLILAYLIKGYTQFISRMIDGFVGTRIAMFAGENKFQSGGAGGVVRSKMEAVKGALGIDKVQQRFNKRLRQGIKKATGFELQTKKEYEKEQIKKNEEAKRIGLRSIKYKGHSLIDLDKNKFNDIIENVSKDKDTKELEEKYGITHTKTASHLGSNVFAKLSRDNIAYKSFIKGMSELRKMKESEVDKLTKSTPGIKALHKVLNSPGVKGSFDDLSSKNDMIKSNAMNRVGKAMFMDKEVSRTLLNEDHRKIFSKRILELGRNPRPGV